MEEERKNRKRGYNEADDEKQEPTSKKDGPEYKVMSLDGSKRLRLCLNRAPVLPCINELSEDVLTQILRLLPTKQCIQSCLVSSRWKNLWKVFPFMELDALSFPRYDKFREFVSGFLNAIGETDLDSFKIVGLMRPEDRLEYWIEKAVMNRVRSFELIGLQNYTLPSCLFRCSTLVSLALSAAQLENIETSCFLPSLKVLKLNRPTHKAVQALQHIVKAAPVLQELTVKLNTYTEPTKLFFVSTSVEAITLYFPRIFEDEFSEQTCDIDTPRLRLLELRGTKPGMVRLLQSSGDLHAHVLLSSGQKWFSLVPFAKVLVLSSPSFNQFAKLVDDRGNQGFENLSELTVKDFKVSQVPQLRILKNLLNIKRVTLEMEN